MEGSRNVGGGSYQFTGGRPEEKTRGDKTHRENVHKDGRGGAAFKTHARNEEQDLPATISLNMKTVPSQGTIKKTEDRQSKTHVKRNRGGETESKKASRTISARL